MNELSRVSHSKERLECCLAIHELGMFLLNLSDDLGPGLFPQHRYGRRGMRKDDVFGRSLVLSRKQLFCPRRLGVLAMIARVSIVKPKSRNLALFIERAIDE